MADFALLVFEDDRVQIEETNIIKKLIINIKNSRSFSKQAIKAESVFEAEDIRVLALKLPVRQDKYGDIPKRKLQTIEAGLLNICEEQQIGKCYLPRLASAGPAFCIRNSFEGRFLFKCLVLEIIELIFATRVDNIGDLRIAFVEGDDWEEIYPVLCLLAPHVKYVSILTDNREYTESMAGSLYEDFGLSIGTTVDYKKGLKDADLVINFKDMRHLPVRPRFGRKTVVINYGKLDNSYLSGHNSLINGIIAGFPSEAFNLEPLKSGIYSQNELAEIFTINRLDIETEPLLLTQNIMASVSKEFKRSGFQIKAFEGSYNIVKVRDFKAG